MHNTVDILHKSIYENARELLETAMPEFIGKEVHCSDFGSQISNTCFLGDDFGITDAEAGEFLKKWPGDKNDFLERVGDDEENFNPINLTSSMIKEAMDVLVLNTSFFENHNGDTIVLTQSIADDLIQEIKNNGWPGFN